MVIAYFLIGLILVSFWLIGMILYGLVEKIFNKYI